jgi:hypothetical protein
MKNQITTTVAAAIVVHLPRADHPYPAGCGVFRIGLTVLTGANAADRLGLLAQRHTLGAANTITQLRTNLPSLGTSRRLPATPLASDLLDGHIARHTRTETGP